MARSKVTWPTTQCSIQLLGACLGCGVLALLSQRVRIISLGCARMILHGRLGESANHDVSTSNGKVVRPGQRVRGEAEWFHKC